MSKYLDDRGLEHLWSKFKAYVDVRPGTSAAPIITITLAADGWTDNQQTVEVSGILADETKQVIQPMPAAANQQAYYDAGILCTGQSVDSLTFSADTVPAEDVTVYVAVTNVGVAQEPIVTYKWWSPEMTSNNTPAPYTASASNPLSNGKLFPYLAFDNKEKVVNDYYHSTNVLGWLQFDFGTKTKVAGLRMYPAYDAENPQWQPFPKNFNIEASNDGTDFDIIYTADPNFDYDPAMYTYRECVFDSIVDYQYYRIRTTGVNYQNTSYMLIGNVQFYRPAQTEVT